MDINQFKASLPIDLRVSVVLPKQNDFKADDTSNALYSTHSIDKEYENKILNYITKLNLDKASRREEIEELICKKESLFHTGKKVMQVNPLKPTYVEQKRLEQFQNFVRTANYYVFNFEIHGDSQERIKPYGLSEISLNEYDKSGKLLKGTGFNGVIHQNKDVIEYLQNKIIGIKHDKNIYNSYNEWEKRSLVNLMRYSSYKTGEDTPFSYTGGVIKHHSIIKSVFDFNDQIDNAKIVKHMNRYIPYMESGLNNMTKLGHSPKEAMQAVIKIMNANKEKYFVSYNGNKFDMQVMDAFAQNLNLKIPKDVKYLDYLNVIRTAYTDSNDLKKKMNPKYNSPLNPYDKDNLVAYQHVLGSDIQDTIQNATDYTAKLIAKSRKHILNKLESTYSPRAQRFKVHKTKMKWEDKKLNNGQILFALGDVQVYQDDNDSFKVGFDDEGHIINKSTSVTETIINAKTLYQFAGVHDMSDGDEKKLAFRFFNPKKNEVSYVVRKGKNAFSELKDFIFNQFYDGENINPQKKIEIKHQSMSNHAYKNYNSFFSLDGTEESLKISNGEIVEKRTKGFLGLKRMLENIKVMQEYLEGAGKSRAEKIKELIRNGYSRKRAKKEVARISTATNIIKKMDFYSLWDDHKKQYTFNESEKNAFFKMYKRLIDEKPYLLETVQKIEETFHLDTQRTAKKLNLADRKKALESINQKRNIALKKYWHLLSDRAGVPKEADVGVNEHHFIKFETEDSARNSIYDHVQRGVRDGKDRQSLIKERLMNLAKNLESQGRIDKKQSNNYTKLIMDSESPRTTSEIAIDISKLNYDKNTKEGIIPSINENTKKRSLLENKEIIKQAIQATEKIFLSFHENSMSEKTIELSKHLTKHLDIFDRERFSRLGLNNSQYLDKVVSGVKKHDFTKNITFTMDPNKAMKLFVYDNPNNKNVQKQLHYGVQSNNAVEFIMPLINNKVHQIDGFNLNMHSDTGLNLNRAKKAVQEYTGETAHVMNAANNGNYEEANKRAKQIFENETENISSISRRMKLGVSSMLNDIKTVKKHEMFESKEGNNLSKEFEYINQDSSIYYLKSPRLYEEQEIVNNNFSNEKGINKGFNKKRIKTATSSKGVTEIVNLDALDKVLFGFEGNNQPIHDLYDGFNLKGEGIGFLKGKTFEHNHSEILKRNFHEFRNIMPTLDHLFYKKILVTGFSSLLEQYKDKHVYSGTMLSQDKVESLTERYEYHELENQHRCGSEFSMVRRNDGIEQKDKAIFNRNEKNNVKEINQLFTPLTNLDVPDGDIQLRKFPKHVLSIYPKIDDIISKPPPIEEENQLYGQLQLQGFVSRRDHHGIKGLMHSKYMLSDDVYKVNMNIFKSSLSNLMDFNNLLKLQDIYIEKKDTVISINMSEKMGWGSKLEGSKHRYNTNVHYHHTLHNGMPFTKLIINDDVNTSEVYRTFLSPILSDTDSKSYYSYISGSLGESEYSRSSLQNVVEDNMKHTGKTFVDISRKIVSKAGQMTRDSAINLNAFINREFSNIQQINETTKEFGHGLKRELIDAKRGARSMGLEMINAAYNHEFNLEKLNEREYLNGKVTRFNKTSGEFSNFRHRMFDKHQNIEVSKGSLEGIKSVSELAQTSMQQKGGNTRNLINKIRNKVIDKGTGIVLQASEKANDLLDTVRNMNQEKTMRMGDALALGGITSYNIISDKKSVMHYNSSSRGDYESRKQEHVPSIEMPNESYVNQNASISIQATGSNMDKKQFSNIVEQSMREIGMSAGPTRITVNHNDNTKQLNRIWYRDKVRQNM